MRETVVFHVECLFNYSTPEMTEPVSRQILDYVGPLHTDYAPKSEFSYANFKVKALVCPKVENSIYQIIERTNSSEKILFN